MQIHQNLQLQPYNTFGISVQAQNAVTLNDLSQWEEVRALYLKHKPSAWVFGGGSNILLTSDLNGLVIFNRLKGIEVLEENEENVLLKVAAGENWHELVMWAVEKNWGGIENMALIPGSVGAAPMQNIGAYGVELKDVLVEVEAFEWESGERKLFSKTECQLDYRSSIFKTSHKNQYLITAITLQLKKNPTTFQLSYGAISDTISQLGLSPINCASVANAVIHIRKSKLPDPEKLGNAGSFFKNPEIPDTQAFEIRRQYPDLPLYTLPEGKVKIPAAWLIEQCGWKGVVVGKTGNHAHQALVIVNYGNALGNEILAHAKKVQHSVLEKFGIQLEMEVNIIPG